MKVILASQSPRRKELMDKLKIPYDIMVSNADETLQEGKPIEEESKRLAYLKAKTIYDQTKEQKDRIIISSDTMCIKDGKLYGKPKTEQEAIENFREFSGKKQEVITSLAILVEENGILQEYQEVEKTKVSFIKMTEEDIRICLQNENVYDKAGGFHINGFSGVYIDKIEGSIATVLGLPIHKVYEILKQYHMFNNK